MFIKKYSRFIILILFISILISVSVKHIHFAYHDTRPLLENDDWYAKYSIHCYNQLRAIFNNTPDATSPENLSRPINLIEKYIGFFFLLFTKSIFSYRLSLLSFFILYLLSVFMLTRKFKNSLVGIFAIIIILGNPAIISTSRECAPQLIMIPFILLAICCFLHGDQQKKDIFILYTGICLGLIMQIHYSGILYVGILLLWISFNTKSYHLTNCALSALTCCLLFASSSLRWMSILFFILLTIFLLKKYHPTANLAIIAAAILATAPSGITNQYYLQSFCMDSPGTQKKIIQNIEFLFSSWWGAYASIYILVLFFLTLLFIKQRTNPLQKKIQYLFLLLVIPSLGALIVNKGSASYILIFTIISILIAINITSLKLTYFKYPAIAIIMAQSLFMYHNNFFKTQNFTDSNAIIADNRNHGVAEITEYFKKKRGKRIRIAVLDELEYSKNNIRAYTFSFFAYELIANHNEIFFIITSPTGLDKHLKANRIDYFILENEPNNKKMLSYQKIIKNNESATLDQTILCPEKTIFIYKNKSH